MSKFRVSIVIAFYLLLGALPATAQEAVGGVTDYANPMIAILEDLGGVECADGLFTCITLTVPLDHTAPDGETLDVVYGVLPATGESYGLFVVATGGPGISGLGSTWYVDYYAPEIPEHFDIVFFDQRGIGESNGLDCTEATAAWYLADLHPIDEAQEQAYIDATQTFVEDCVVEMDADWLLPYLGTGQAIHDLEAFRQAVGTPPMYLYGESYGTQFAQEYATAYPDAVTGLILDGVVDLTLTGEDFYVGQTQAFSDVLTATLEACNADAACSADFGTDAVAFFDDLAAELLAAPMTIDFRLPSGATVSRTYTLGMLENSAYNAVYERSTRASLLRALAAAANGDFQPLLRLGYTDFGFDPQTEELSVAYGDGAAPYYLVECSDYTFFGGGEGGPQAWLDSGDAIEETVPRLSFIYYTDLPCAFWPAEGLAERPEPFVAGDYTTFILNTNTDPATPVSNGYDVFDRLVEQGADVYMITQQGGPHVIYGRELLCPDVAVNRWLLDGVLPLETEFVCEGSVIDAYAPLSPASQADFEDIEAIMQAIDTEIQNLPEYVNWDVYTPTLVGCPYGGVMTFAASEDGERFAFADCGFFDGVVVNGSGEWIYDDSLWLDVALSGAAEGSVYYLKDEAAGMFTVTGDYDGEDITLTP